MKTAKLTRFILTFVVALTMIMGINITANAATVSQTAQTQDSVTVSFDSKLTGSNKLTGWTIKLQKYENGNYIDIMTSGTLTPNVTNYTFTGLTAGTKYYVKVEYTYNYSSGTSTSGSTSGYAFTMPGKVTGLNQTKWWYFINKVDFAWDIQDACKYEWVAFQGKKEVARNETESTYNSSSFNVKNNKLYTVQVRAYTDINGQRVYGEWSDKAYLFTQPMVTKNGVKINGKGQMTVKWNKISGVDSYEVFVSTKETKGYKRVAKVKAKKGSVTIKKFKKKSFKKNKKYFVYIMAKKKVGGDVYTSGRHYTMMYKKGNNDLRWSFDKQ